MNEYARVKDDEVTTSSAVEQNRGNNGGNSNGKFNKSKRKGNEDFGMVREDIYKGVNTVFMNPIHKIMFDNQNQPYFKWPRQMGGNPTTRNSKLQCSYHKDHGHLTEHCKTLR